MVILDYRFSLLILHLKLSLEVSRFMLFFNVMKNCNILTPETG